MPETKANLACPSGLHSKADRKIWDLERKYNFFVTKTLTRTMNKGIRRSKLFSAVEMFIILIQLSDVILGSDIYFPDFIQSHIWPLMLLSNLGS